MTYRKCFSLFLFLFFFSFLFSESALQLVVQYEDEKKPTIDLSSFYPFNLYLDSIDISYQKKEILPYRKYGDSLVIRFRELRQLSPNPRKVFIFIVKEEIRGKGGILSLNDGMIRYVFVSRSHSPSELFHEICHAFPGLGDEYCHPLQPFYPKEKSRKDGKTDYPNLTTLDENHLEWEEIRRGRGEKVDGKYYEGGGGYRSGIYHAYPACLMQSLESPLCPICVFYVRKELEELTQKNE